MTSKERLTDAANRTCIYPQGDQTAPPSGMMPEGGYFFDTQTDRFGG
ncbi:MAG: hypothetical protein GXY44_13570 [Phycisphaerales bacterium]|nr:hypothetical protein [Phycisphaerales bacterium]